LIFPGLLLAAGAVWLAGCNGKAEGTSGAESTASAPRRAASAPAVPVTIVVARREDFVVTIQAIGTAAPVSSVDVKAQVTSVITKVHVQEGQSVRAGDLLFTLDSRSDEANVAKMRAQVAKDEAALADARRQLRAAASCWRRTSFRRARSMPTRPRSNRRSPRWRATGRR